MVSREKLIVAAIRLMCLMALALRLADRLQIDRGHRYLVSLVRRISL